ncbi:MAG: hypothetical protein ACN6P1_04915 [Pseudomonas sp.]|uniref:hypothetical protein n=1 Tax=Pseudomonas sp. TaxID=306 RepID=UPI003D142ED1
MKKWILFLAALQIAGCASPEEILIKTQLEKAVIRAEREAISDSYFIAKDCQEEAKTWRAPIRSLTQDIRVQRCDTVYYYLARYSMVQGDVLPIAFIPSIYLQGTENVVTGERTD